MTPEARPALVTPPPVAAEKHPAAGRHASPAAELKATDVNTGSTLTTKVRAKPGSGKRILLPRRGRAWDGQQVAEHLMSCRSQMVYGLRRKTPWAGLDDETLESCFSHGAAVIARVASSGERPEWRTARDLEKAQIAAFRHQALDHWKRVNAQSRQGDRLAVEFDPERHAAPDAPIDRLYEQPDLHAIQRDLLAELDDPDLRGFWTPVLQDTVSFKAAGDKLGLNKAQVMARTRAGRAAFAAYLDRRDTGELCRVRELDIRAWRSGSADDAAAERAQAHLACCYACSLVHERARGAFERGILGVAPTGLVLRLLARLSDLASTPAGRITETVGGARLLAGGLTAVTIAGAGVDAASRHSAPEPRPVRPYAHAKTATVSAPTDRIPAAVLLPATTKVREAPSGSATPERPRSDRLKRADASPSPTVSRQPAATSAAPAGEFSFERRATASPNPPLTTHKHPSAPTSEFGGP